MTRPRPSEPARSTDPFLLLPLVSARLNRLYTKVLSQLSTPLTYRQHRTLVRVRSGHTSLVALAQFSNLSLPTVSENVDGLVRRGLLNRQEHPDDRRSVLLGLTPRGRETCQEADEAVAKVTADLLQDVPERSRAALGRSLALIFDAATAWLDNESA